MKLENIFKAAMAAITLGAVQPARAQVPGPLGDVQLYYSRSDDSTQVSPRLREFNIIQNRIVVCDTDTGKKYVATARVGMDEKPDLLTFPDLKLIATLSSNSMVYLEYTSGVANDIAKQVNDLKLSPAQKSNLQLCLNPPAPIAYLTIGKYGFAQKLDRG